MSRNSAHGEPIFCCPLVCSGPSHQRFDRLTTVTKLSAPADAASAYIKSQTHAGWTLIRSRYDDGGYSGGSTDRPDLQRLLDDSHQSHGPHPVRTTSSGNDSD